ncbi:ImmA/IrrE family metallo-endopeptidase [Nocardioides korecus]
MLESVLDVLDIEVWFADLPGFVCGRTVYSHGARRIELAQDGQSEQARMFTLAHEVGHCLVDDWRDLSKAPNYLPTDPAALETLCNKIAAEILLPRAWMTQRIADMASPSVDEFREIADAADTSLTAVLIRALQLRTPLAGRLFYLQADGHWRLVRSYGRDARSVPRTRGVSSVPPRCEMDVLNEPLASAARSLPAEVTQHLSPHYSWTWRRQARTMWAIGSTETGTGRGR